MFAAVNCYTISSAVECTYAVFHADGTSIKKPFRILHTRLQGATILPTGCHYTIHNAPQRDAEWKQAKQYTFYTGHHNKGLYRTCFIRELVVPSAEPDSDSDFRC